MKHSTNKTFEIFFSPCFKRLQPLWDFVTKLTTFFPIFQFWCLKQSHYTNPLEISSSTTASLELSIALIKGVPPLMVCASISAPFSSRNCTRSTCPEWQAWCKGVHLKLSRALMSALENKAKGLDKCTVS